MACPTCWSAPGTVWYDSTLAGAVGAGEPGGPYAYGFRVESAPTANPWQCPVFPLDVNHDGLITPLDALIVINYLNAHGPGALPAQPAATLAPPPYLDCSDDWEVTALDALLVINDLAAHGPPPSLFRRAPAARPAGLPSRRRVGGPGSDARRHRSGHGTTRSALETGVGIEPTSGPCGLSHRKQHAHKLPCVSISRRAASMPTFPTRCSATASLMRVPRARVAARSNCRRRTAAWWPSRSISDLSEGTKSLRSRRRSGRCR